jgi:predicted phage terminase large subunit-like protein
MKNVDLALLQKLNAEDSLAEFVKQSWHIIEPNTPLIWSWHLDLICEHLELMAAGVLTKLVINVPPRTLKSIIASVMFPVWVWTPHPETRWLFASYSAALSTKHSRDRRVVISSPWYQARWAVRLAHDNNQAMEFSNVNRGHMIATSVGGTATGRGGDYVVGDDLQSPQMADSEAERESALRFWDESLGSRLDDKKTGRQLVIMQRLNQRDLTAHVIEQGGWTVVSLPAIAERRTVVVFPKSGREIVRNEGDLLNPNREGQAELDAVRQRLGSFGFQAQYQQNPTPREGSLFKTAWIRRYALLPARADWIVMALDTAYRTGATNDYSAAVVVAYVASRRDGIQPGYYVVDVMRRKLEFPDLKHEVIKLFEKWRPDACLIEAAASGVSLSQALRSETVLPIVEVRADSDKLTRASAITALFESGRVFFPESAPWLTDLESELTGFPGAAHDDQTDALIYALNYLRGSSGGSYEAWSQTMIGGFFGQTTPASVQTPIKRWNAKDAMEKRLEAERRKRLCGYCREPVLDKSFVSDGLNTWHCLPCPKDRVIRPKLEPQPQEESPTRQADRLVREELQRAADIIKRDVREI